EYLAGKTLKTSESSRSDVTRIAMHAIVIITTPDQTSARRCVIVRAMKSLMRMSKPPFNTNRREHANAAAGSDREGREIASACLRIFCRCAEDSAHYRQRR